VGTISRSQVLLAGDAAPPKIGNPPRISICVYLITDIRQIASHCLGR